jgi:hypothetical protein
MQFWDSISGGGHRMQTGALAQQASTSMGTPTLPSAVKQSNRDTGHWPPSSVEEDLYLHFSSRLDGA